MQIDSINDVVRAGLAYERSRAEVASYNLAIANVALPPDVASPLRQPALPSAFAQQLGLAGRAATPTTQSTRAVHDPGHPLADANGMVHFPRVDTALEMTALVSATRAYEANVRSYNTLRAMTLKAFEIGK